MTELAQIEQEGPGTGSTEAPEGSGNSRVIFYWRCGYPETAADKLAAAEREPEAGQ